MAENDSTKPARTPLSAAAVGDYLLAHPEFFQEQKKLLARLSIPHPAGGAVSLVERQVEVLRQENRRLERRLIDWMEIAQDNDRLLGQLHTLAVALLAAGGRNARWQSLRTSLRDDFRAAAVALIVHDDARAAGLDDVRVLAGDDAAFAGLATALKDGKPFCRTLNADQSERLFPGETGLASAAWVPLDLGGAKALLVLASADPKHFHPALDTTYLARLGELAGAALAGATLAGGGE